MKNISFFFVLVSILLLSPVSASAQENSPNNGVFTNNALSLAVLGGFIWGQGEEIVYQGNPSRNDSLYLSRLLWDFKPLVILGIELDYTPLYPWLNYGFYSSFSFKLGLPFDTGIMIDRDWMAYGDDFLTHHSQHDASSRSTLNDLITGYGTFTANLSAGFSWSFFDRLWLRPYGEFAFLRFSWKSRDGYIQYGPNSTNPKPGDVLIPWDPDSPLFPKIANTGPAINYSQNWLAFAPGIAAGINFSGSLNLMVFAAWTPFVYGECRDDHLSPTKTNTYLDYLYGGLYIKEGISLEFAPHERVSVNFSAILMNLKGSKGDNYTSEHGESGPFAYSPGIAGGGFSFGEFCLSVNYRF